MPATAPALPRPPQPAASALDVVFRQLMAEHRERLVRFVMRHIGHLPDAEDLAQQAFAEAARTYASFRGDSQLSTWLYGIALNLVRHHLTRGRHREPLAVGDEVLEDLACEHAEPDVRCDHGQLLRHLEADLEGLMPEMREVLLLVALDELSYEQAAHRLALPVGTVRSRVSRARGHLRRRMQARGAVLPF
jgi:RNA polymerase sigma-70 factor (ECF subfamily)